MFTILRHQNCDGQVAYTGQATGILYTRDAKPIWGKLGKFFISLRTFAPKTSHTQILLKL